MKFEEKISKIEEIIISLENNDTDLEDSIAKYTEAINLIKECDIQLKNIEENINKVVSENGTLEDLEEVE